MTGVGAPRRFGQRVSVLEPRQPPSRFSKAMENQGT
jgi:hypothetical protein